MMNLDNHEQNVSDEPFELLKPLGSGGFAHTYLVRVLDEDLIQEFGSEQVALKIPLSRQKAGVLKREIELDAALHLRLKNLSSVNIVRYLGFDFFRGMPVMAMEYMPNGSLRNLIGGFGRQKRLPVEQAATIAIEALKGLMVIHNEHILHRDIKPENILMDGKIPKIADLGIGRMLNSNEMASSSTGTIFYMSPEILGQGASYPTDIWSMGVTLYEMVTGRLPFGDQSTPHGTLIDLIRQGNHVPACEICPDIPASLSTVIDIALNKQPAKRFSNAKEMHDALVELAKKPDDLEQEYARIRELLNSAEAGSKVESNLRQLVSKYPQNPKSYQYLGEFYNRCQRHLDALDAFQKGLTLDPQNALLHWDSALAAQKLGKKDEAVLHLEKALALNLDPSLKRFAESLLRSLRGGVK